MSVWFTADTHWGHGGALGLFKRPFASVAEMDEAMVARWNARVAPADEVWHLGDFAVPTRKAAAEGRAGALLERLHGRKRLIVGNNDTDAVRALPGWHEVADYAETTVEGTPLVLCHYAFRSWKNQHRGWWNLHGHSHGALKPLTRQRDVGVDVWGFALVRLAAIMRKRSVDEAGTAPQSLPKRPTGRAR